MMPTQSKHPAVLSALLLCLPLPGFAEEATESEGRHIVEFFYGGTFAEREGEDESAFSVGLSYRYAFSDRISAGLLAEYARDPLDSTVVGVPVVWHLGEGWQLTAMPGAEIEDGEEEFLFRIGAGYEFLTSHGVGLKPEINVDMVDGDVSIVPGLSIGFRF